MDLVGLTARLVRPRQVLAGHLNRLLGALWLTGGLWALVGLAGGLAVGGFRPGILAVGVVAVLVGAVLVVREARLPEPAYVMLTAAGAAAIAVVVLWGGPVGGAVFGVVYVYVSCFTLMALRRHAAWLVILSAVLHLAALVLSSHPHVLGVWGVTWGTALVTGLLAGSAVDWLRQAVVQVRHADDQKTKFVATVSHELRTPLAAILGATETLEQHWDDLGEDHRTELVAVIDRQARRQLRLVNDVLAITTQLVEASSPEPTAVDAAQLLAGTVRGLSFDVDVAVAGPVVVRVDPDHLSQVVENLLVNADRYGQPPLLVRAAREDGRGCIEVVDHGRGLEGGLEGGLLEPFVQGDSGDRRSASGVGLGLTICRELVAANFGTLTYRETPGGGATFRIALPLAVRE